MTLNRLFPILIVLFLIAGCNQQLFNKNLEVKSGAQAGTASASSSLKPVLVAINPIFVAVDTDPLKEIFDFYTGFDINSDGLIEINSVSTLDTGVDKEINSGDKLLLVIIEDRLLDTELPPNRLYQTNIMPSLETYKQDLKRDGFTPRFIRASVYKGVVHQDGMTLLAIRRMFQAVRAKCNSVGADFEGAVFVGSFPEATIVRSHAWNVSREKIVRDADVTGMRAIEIYPGIVAKRAEIVLSDLDGNWEDVYVREHTVLPFLYGVPISGTLAEGHRLQAGDVYDLVVYTETATSAEPALIRTGYRDVFYLQDLHYRFIDGDRVELTDNTRNSEVGGDDLSTPNLMARPDILVSRINTKYIANGPDLGFEDNNGNNFLDANGKPQRVKYGSGVFDKAETFSAELERHLLIEYFARNHRHRMGLGFVARGAVVAYDLGTSNMAYQIQNSLHTMQGVDQFDDASLHDVVDWLKTPAVFKGINAHSSGFSSSFKDGTDIPLLESQTGNAPWNWVFEQEGSQMYMAPSFIHQDKRADFNLYKTVWGNGILKGLGGSFYVHGGCESISPNGHFFDYSYNDARYGNKQNAESLLYYGNGLALLGRSKTYNDHPKGYADVLRAGKTFGESWAEYFEIDANDNDMNNHIASQKRAYFWSVLGDWTLRLHYAPSFNALEVDRYDEVVRNDTFDTVAQVGMRVPLGANIDHPEDVDFFRIQLPGAVSKTGQRECSSTTSGTRPSIAQLVKKGYFKIQLNKTMEVSVYKSNGQLVKKEITNMLKFECPHGIFDDGKVIFSVKSTNTTKNYTAYLTYKYEENRIKNFVKIPKVLAKKRTTKWSKRR